MATTNGSDFQTTIANMSFTSTTGQTTKVAEPEPVMPKRTMVYVLVPLGTILFVAFLILIVILVIRKSKLERLRHHLMPMYSFDPAEESPDWESELLEDQDKDSNHSPASASSPMLKFLPRK